MSTRRSTQTPRAKRPRVSCEPDASDVAPQSVAAVINDIVWPSRSPVPVPNEDNPDRGKTGSWAGTGTTIMPTRSFKALWHVGDLSSLTPYKARSHEGDGISVSTCPEAWTRIAKLGGSDTWLLTKPGNRFLDAHACSTTQRKAITAWAVASGLLTKTSVYRVHSTDEEGEPRYMEFTDKAHAQAEADDACEPLRITTVSAWAATPALAKRLGWKPPPSMAQDIATAMYAEAHGFDGAVWNDIYDPDDLSAPRAVIAQHAIRSWTTRCLTDA